MTRPPRSRALEHFASDAHGVVLVEFLIAFGPLLLMFLATVQLALISVADLVVHHAAVAGVRAAVVVLDDDPRFYRGAERGSLADAGDSGRMAAIRRAVYMRIAAIVPDPNVLGPFAVARKSASVGNALGPQPLSRLALDLERAAGMSTAVTFPTAPGASASFETRIEPTATVTLRVTHLFPCLVPIVSALLCIDLTWDEERRQIAVKPGSARPTPQQLDELRRAPFAADQQQLARPGIATRVLDAEATLPAQSAAYLYASERKSEAPP